MLPGGRPGPHKLQGLGVGFVPKALETSLIDEMAQVTTDQAFAMACRVPHEESILVGISSGAAIQAAVRVAKRPGNAGKRIVVIVPPSVERYLSTALFANLEGRASAICMQPWNESETSGENLC